jgi:hypothetical protein
MRTKNFYNFLLALGLTPRKSKTIGELQIPREFFAHFFRGCIDGDGSITISSHPESKRKQLKIRLCSASKNFILWIKSELSKNIDLDGGWIYTYQLRPLHTLTYGKADSIKILNYMYHDKSNNFLARKFEIAKTFMGK